MEKVENLQLVNEIIMDKENKKYWFSYQCSLDGHQAYMPKCKKNISKLSLAMEYSQNESS
jgi:hypothetical protein